MNSMYELCPMKSKGFFYEWEMTPLNEISSNE